MTIHSDAFVDFYNNDIAAGTIVAVGDSADSIDLRWNWWGSTDPAVIGNKITDQLDDASRPLVLIDPWLIAWGGMASWKPDFFSQNDPQWRDDPIGASGASVAEIGCAMTSMAMVLRGFGVDTDPGRLNAWLSAHGGYTADGRLYWRKADDYSDGQVQYATAQAWTTTNPTLDNDRWAELKALLDGGYGVIVQVDGNLGTPELNTHWVLVSAFQGESITNPANYLIHDPWLLQHEERTLAHYSREPFDKSTFFAMRPFHHGAGTFSGAADLGELAVGEGLSRQGSIGEGAPEGWLRDVYRFSVPAAGRVALDVQAERIGSTLDGYLRLFDASGRELAANDDTHGMDPHLAVNLAAGTYYVGVSGYPNRFYDPLRPGVGETEGSMGYYQLNVAVETEPPPPGGSITLGSLLLVGDFQQQLDGTHRATGEVVIGNLLTVHGEVWYTNESSLYGHGRMWVENVPILDRVQLYEGEFRFDAGAAVTDSLNHGSFGLEVAGLGVQVNRLSLVTDAVRIEGSLVLPKWLGETRVDFAAPQYIEIGPHGLAYELVISSDIHLEVAGVRLYATDARLEVSNADGDVRGILTGRFGMMNVFEGVEVNLAEDQGNYFAFGSGGWNLNGSLVVGRVDIVPNALYADDVHVRLDTSTRSFYAEGTVGLPLGMGVEVGGSIDIVDGYLDGAALSFSDPGQLLWLKPPIFLESIGGSVEHLTPYEIDGKQVTISVDSGLRMGPSLGEYRLLYLDVEGSLALDGRFSMKGELGIGNPDDPFALGMVRGLWDPSVPSLRAGGTIAFGDWAELGGHLALYAGAFYGDLHGMITAPGWAGGWTVASGRAYMQYIDDDNPNNDFLFAGGRSILPWPLNRAKAVRVNLNTFEPEWHANYHELESLEFRPFPQPQSGSLMLSGAREGESEVADASRTSHGLAIPVGLGAALFRATWDEGETELLLTDPSGVTYTADNVDEHPEVLFGRNPNAREALFEVYNPAGGTWRVTVTNAPEIGGYTVESRALTEAPVITVLEPSQDVAGGPVSISWIAEPGDLDATISLYYDTDRGGANGVPIIEGLSAAMGTTEYVWDTSELPTGEYYVYAVISDGANVPEMSYSTGRVSVVETNAPASVTGLTAWAGTETTAKLAWDAVAEAQYYLVGLTDDAAGEFYPDTFVAAGTELVLGGLAEGASYRVAVAAMDAEGRVSPYSDPIALVAGGEYAAGQEAGPWRVFVEPGGLYEAQVPLLEGDVPTRLEVPTGATLDRNGLFTWQVPDEANGWHQVLIHVTLASGETEVYRYHLLSDGESPYLDAGQVEGVAIAPEAIRVTAPRGYDASGALQYQWERDGSVVPDWQLTPVLVDGGLEPNTTYEYRVRLKDSSPNGNISDWSAPLSVSTLAELPGAPMVEGITATTVLLEGYAFDGNHPGTEYALYNTTAGSYVAEDGSAADSAVWLAAIEWAAISVVGLAPDTEYSFQARARNVTDHETELGAITAIRTLRDTTPPMVVAVTEGRTSVTMEFSQPVAISLKDVSVLDDADSPVDLAGVTLLHEPGSSIATLHFAETLPEEKYTLVLRGEQVQDLAGNLLDGNGDGTGGDDYVVQFTLLRSPQVEGVLLRGSAWAEDFLDDLDAAGLGHADIARLGYRIPDGDAQLDPLPWANLDTIAVTFNADVSVSAEDLGVWGVNVPHYAVATDEFAYDPATFTATWTLAEPLEADKLLLVLPDTVTNTEGIPLDGEWEDGVSTVSGDGTPGGDFQFRFNVLPGDATNSGNVVAGDVSMLASAFGSFAGDSNGRYSPFVDFDGSGNVVAGDVSILASHFGQFLPGADPVPPESEGTAATAVGTTSVSGVPARAPETATVVADHERAPEAGLMLPGQGVIGRNPTTPADVNGDGYVSSIDALLVIRYLNDPASAWPSAVPDTSPFYFDVNGDGTVSPSDALRVIAHLNAEGSGTVDAEREATASRRLVSDRPADAPPSGGPDQSLAAVPAATASVADGRSIAPCLQDKVHGHMAKGVFPTLGDDTILEQDNIEMPGLLAGNRGHSPRRMAAPIPSNPAREHTRRERESAVDRYFEDPDDAGEAVFLDGSLLDELMSRKG